MSVARSAHTPNSTRHTHLSRRTARSSPAGTHTHPETHTGLRCDSDGCRPLRCTKNSVFYKSSTSSWTQRVRERTGLNSLVSQRGPTNPYGQEQVCSPTHVPPFSHGNLHRAAHMHRNSHLASVHRYWINQDRVGERYLPGRFLHGTLVDTDTRLERCTPPRSHSPARRSLKKTKINKHLTNKRAESVTCPGCCWRTCLTVQSGVAGFAAARVGRGALHVPAAHVSAHRWKKPS